VVLAATVRSRDPDDVALGIGEHAEGHSGHFLRRLHDASAELLCAAKRAFDVLHADEEQDGVAVAL
jgi:hypothetical protein